jgi:hypothetical protein
MKTPTMFLFFACSAFASEPCESATTAKAPTKTRTPPAAMAAPAAPGSGLAAPVATPKPSDPAPTRPAHLFM